MSYPFDQSLIWHVIFHRERKWWALGEYSHVSLAGFSNDTWLHLDLHKDGMSVASIYHYEEVQDFLSFLLTYTTVVRFGPTVAQKRHFFRPMTCVSFVKHTLGVRSSALLPGGLLRDLVRDYSAEVLNENPKAPRGNDRAEATAASG